MSGAGGLGVIVTLLFACLVSDLPSQNKRIGLKERRYIEKAVEEAGGHGHKEADENSPLTVSLLALCGLIVSASHAISMASQPIHT